MQPGLCGYFGSGSGVASQEQCWSAYGLAKAFWELDLDIPAVIRLGGNTEDRAVRILHAAREGLRAAIEGYKKTDTPAVIASRFGEHVSKGTSSLRDDSVPPSSPSSPFSEPPQHLWKPRAPRTPAFVGASSAASFPITDGTLWIDTVTWAANAPAIIAQSAGLLQDDNGSPALADTPEELAKKDSELIACEVECRNMGVEGVFVDLKIPGLAALNKEVL